MTFSVGVATISFKTIENWSGKTIAEEIWACCHVPFVETSEISIRWLYVEGQVSESFNAVLEIKKLFLFENFEKTVFLFYFFVSKYLCYSNFITKHHASKKIKSCISLTYRKSKYYIEKISVL